MRKLLLTSVFTIFVTVVFQFGIGPLPPLGKALNPFSGVWKNQPDNFSRESQTLEIKGLKKAVRIFWDENSIPHLYAENDHDLYLAQGYVLARERLWQMDTHTRIAAGRLSEVAGDKTLKMDRFFTSIGMRSSAKKALAEMLSYPQTKLAVEAYTKGVNAYISGLKAKNYPAEYKLADSAPEKWQPIRTAFLLKVMAFGLAGRSMDLQLTRLAKKYGVEKIKNIYRDFPENAQPIVDSAEVSRASLGAGPRPEGAEEFFPSEFDEVEGSFKPSPHNGSNNWAIAGSKSTTGYSIVANDTHLEYYLPSIWYEMQLSTPEWEVYGATFPAAPGIIDGFNKNMSWAVTNATMDTMDWYEVKFKDESFSEYWFEGAWKPAKHEVEVIHVRGSADVELELVWTHHGVVVSRKGTKGLVLRWMPQQKSNDLMAFYKLNRANTFAECKQALGYYSSPAQNFICADKDNIGIWHNGQMPKKWQGQGRFVLDGSKAVNGWNDSIAWSELPGVENPKTGFVASANQLPVGKSYPNYMGWYYADSYRARRISEMLSSDADKKLSALDMIAMQNDDLDHFARDLAPLLVSIVSGHKGLTAQQRSAIKLIKNWDFVNDKESVVPTMFHSWFKKIQHAVWKDQLHSEALEVTPFPFKSRTYELLVALSKDAKHSDAFWLDDVTTDNKETLQQVVLQAFGRAWQENTERLGPFGPTWQLASYKETKFKHLGRIPGFGESNLEVGGGQSSIHSNKGWHGAVWKMVVQLGPDFRAWINFPGGPSGNPFDDRYIMFLSDWAKGEMREVKFYSTDNLTAKPSRGVVMSTLSPGGDE